MRVATRRSVDHKVNVLSPLRMLDGSIGIHTYAMTPLGEQRQIGQMIAGDAAYQRASIADLQHPAIERLPMRMGRFLSLPDLYGNVPINISEG